ncbi:MAG TPA: ABC transporter permease subunit, partial [Candidatus Methanoperedens sp.]|nr:ABC transporter permease subunit [Candidatus Methanoperedens sp.]
LAIYSVGYLSKLYYEAFEAVYQEVIEAVRATGISRLKEIRFVVLPESMNHILSQLFFMFEYNVRSSAILGFVGAGGIGFYMISYIQLFQYQRLTTAVLLTLAVVLVIDLASARIRDRFLTTS